MRDKRLLICAPGIPHESRGASTVLFYHYIERFKRERFNVLNLLLLRRQDTSEAQLAEYTAKLAEPGRFEVEACWADEFVTSGRVAHHLAAGVAADVERRARAFEPDAPFCVDLLSAWVTRDVASPAKVVWLGDLNFQTVWYHAWYAAKENVLRAAKLPVAWL